MRWQGWRLAVRTVGGTALACAALAFGLGSGVSSARALRLEDLLQREGFGAVSIAPGGRWLLVEQRGPFASGSRFDFGEFNPLFRTRLMVADRAAGAALHPLFKPEPGVGYRAGPISPDGARAVVYRLTATRWQLGIATFATRKVRWLNLTPEIVPGARPPQWVSPSRLFVIALAPGELPFQLRAQRPQAASPALWRAAARGETVVTAVGSGEMIAIRARMAPKRLLLVPVTGGTATTLATGDLVDFEISATGQHVALLEAGEDIHLAATHPVQGAYGVATRRIRLRIVDLRTRTITSPCPQGDVLASLLNWSPRRETLLAYVRSDGAPWTEGHLVLIDGVTGQSRALDLGVMASVVHRPERVSAGWWDAEPLLFGRLASGTRNDWFRLTAKGPVQLTSDLLHPSPEDVAVSPEGLIATADGAAWRIDREGRATRLTDQPFTPLPDRSESIPDRTTYALRDDETLAGVLGAGGEARAVRIDAQGRRRTEIAAAGIVTALGPTDAVIDEKEGGGQEVLVWRHVGAPDKKLARINASWRDLDLPRPIAVPHPGPNGETLKSWLFLPGAPPGAPPSPLVVVPYPGSSHATAPALQDQGLMEPAAILLANGYAVLIPSLPTWKAGDGPSDGLARRVLAIADAAARQSDLVGRLDLSRMGLWGHSFGGYGAVAIIGQTDRFAVAVASAPATDLASDHGAFGPQRRMNPDEGVGTPWSAGWVEDLQGDMHAPPWEAPGRYWRNSPLMQAGSIHTPLMLAYGEIDGSHPGQAEELFSALFRQDKDAVLLTYWGEPHLFGSPGNLRDFYGRGLAFLDRYLRPPGHEARPQNRESGSASTEPTTPPPPP